MLSKRFRDKDNFREIIKNCKNFKIRYDNPPELGLLNTLFAIFVLFWLSENILGLAFFNRPFFYTLYSSFSAKLPIPGSLLAGIILLILILCVFLSLMNRVRLGIVSSEFQNMLFSRVLQNMWNFCVIFRKDGEVVYGSKKYFEFFENKFGLEETIFDGLFNFNGLSTADKNQLKEGILKKNETTVTLKTNLENKNAKSFTLKLTPLDTPEDYYIITANLE